MEIHTNDEKTEPRAKHLRKWGHYVTLYEQPGLKAKVLQVEPGQNIPLQFHCYHDEHWLVLAGRGTAALYDEELSVQRTTWRFKPTLHFMEVGQIFDIPRNRPHRITNESDVPLVFLEIQVGQI
ncbi:hypothetical protein LCGC14_3067140, partial [marine sediment metagenome]